MIDYDYIRPGWRHDWWMIPLVALATIGMAALPVALFWARSFLRRVRLAMLALIFDRHISEIAAPQAKPEEIRRTQTAWMVAVGLAGVIAVVLAKCARQGGW